MYLERNFGECDTFVVFSLKMLQRRDNAGAVCNSGMGMLFLCIYFFLHYFFEGGVEFFLMQDA